ncbi:MAG TPA: transglycosylase SLT domain-containing protein [Candidatus Margulisiibacteriota bacterium]|nr:transglycosylase SLT domain-containing protein [Candidatus Margulisiibacteriota bacterium]
MTRLPTFCCCSYLILTVLVPGGREPVGRADTLSRPARVARPSNPVGTLFAALSQCRRGLSERERWRIAGVIHRESQRYGYDPLFVVALAAVESTCLPTARSRHGAVGLIQIRPSVARAVAQDAGVRWRGDHMLTKPLFNVHLGLRYLTQLEKRFGDPYLAMAAYNLGPTRVSGMSRHRAKTTQYVQKVLSRYETLLAQHRPRVSRADS